jgi:RNA polymerase sigma-B factor
MPEQYSRPREAVTRHWDELPEREQRILVLRFYGNFSREEFAERVGISQMHVSRLLARALSQLRDRLLLDPAARCSTASDIA